MTSHEIFKNISRLGGFHSITIPEFTWLGLRIDAIHIDFEHRWIRGFEIKTARGDWLKDNKWVEYSEFCSSLAVVCPRGLIQPTEIDKPFGLLWIGEKNNYPLLEWKKRPLNFQKRNSLAWLYTYIKVMEKEFPRMAWELEQTKTREAIRETKGGDAY